MKKITFYVAFGMLAATGTGLFGLSAARIAQAKQQTKGSIVVRGDKPIFEPKQEIIRCGTPRPTPEQILDDEKTVQAFMSRAKGAGQRGGPGARGPGTAIIPVWFHIIKNTSGAGEISDEKIYAQLKVMNVAYSGKDRRATQLGAIAAEQPTANTVCRFVLAGIDRTVNDTWYTTNQTTSDFQAMKTALRKGENPDGQTGPKTLNVYLKSFTNNLLGIATFPYSYNSAPLQDGIVCLNTTVPGGAAAPRFNLGKTVVHEAGHWVGLYHTFEGQTSPGVNDGCNGSTGDFTTTVQGDGVNDTPAELDSYVGAVPASYPDTCPAAGRDPIENYMDYSDDDVYFQFTAGQDARLDTRIATYRGL